MEIEVTKLQTFNWGTSNLLRLGGKSEREGKQVLRVAKSCYSIGENHTKLGYHSTIWSGWDADTVRNRICNISKQTFFYWWKSTGFRCISFLQANFLLNARSCKCKILAFNIKQTGSDQICVRRERKQEEFDIQRTVHRDIFL